MHAVGLDIVFSHFETCTNSGLAYTLNSHTSHNGLINQIGVQERKKLYVEAIMLYCYSRLQLT